MQLCRCNQQHRMHC